MEGAIGGVLFFFVVFVIIEGAFFCRAILCAEYGSTSGARMGAVSGNDPEADYYLLGAVTHAASGMARSAVTRVIVYKAMDPSSPVPPGCLSGPVDGECNVYTNADFSRPSSDFTTATWGGDLHWASPGRSVSRSAGPDYLGVYVEASVPRFANVLPGTVTRTSVVRLEAGSA